MVGVVIVCVREEVVVREEFVVVVRVEYDFVLFVFLVVLVFESVVLRVVDEVEFDGFFGGDVGVEVVLIGGVFFGFDVEDVVDGWVDIICIDDEVVLCFGVVFECDGVGGYVNIFVFDRIISVMCYE